MISGDVDLVNVDATNTMNTYRKSNPLTLYSRLYLRFLWCVKRLHYHMFVLCTVW